jgi:hypothetical protein
MLLPIFMFYNSNNIKYVFLSIEISYYFKQTKMGWTTSILRKYQITCFLKRTWLLYPHITLFLY